MVQYLTSFLCPQFGHTILAGNLESFLTAASAGVGIGLCTKEVVTGDVLFFVHRDIFRSFMLCTGIL